MEVKRISLNRCLVIMAVIVLLLASSCTGSLIITLEAESPWTAPLSSLLVRCIASSPDGGALSYNWLSTGGYINGTHAVVNWIAPGEVGMYDITVKVNDDQGREGTASITLIASNGPPPTIQSLNVTAQGHPYLKRTSTGYKVAKTYNYTIECIASGRGELVYEWSCTGGNISGEGSIITWTAPNTKANVTVTVKVFDGVGNWVKKSIVFEVVDCSACVKW